MTSELIQSILRDHDLCHAFYHLYLKYWIESEPYTYVKLAEQVPELWSVITTATCCVTGMIPDTNRLPGHEPRF